MGTTYKWGDRPQSETVAFFHRRVRETVEERLEASGKTWQDFVWDGGSALRKEDIEAIERELLDTGRRFDFSARISVEEAPEKYNPLEQDAADVELERDEQGRAVVGSGDNVFRWKEDVVGTARVISSIETVMEMLTEGVPEGTVAIIDDSGGTLTAPILEGFMAVVCKGGSIRSHLGILTREYNIPCLMAAEVSNLADGDQVQVEYTADPVSPYATTGNVRARIWKLS